MKDSYKKMMAGIKMAQIDSDAVRDNISHMESKKGYRGGRAWKYAVSAAAVIALLLCFPQVRSFAGSAVQKFIAFTFSDGTKGEICEDETARIVSIEIAENESFFTVENGKVYFTFDGNHKDITDFLGADKSFRYEKTLKSGKSVIFIGGEPGKYGRCELVFDAEGNYITNRMNVPAESDMSTPEWLKNAMHGEGVPCGDPQLDKLLTE